MPRYFLPIVTAFLLVTSCKSDKKDTNIPLEFTPKTITERSTETCDTDDFTCTIISLELISAQGPEEASQRINHALEQHIIDIVSTVEDSTAASLEELAKNFIESQQKIAEKFNEAMPWRALVNTSVYSHSKNLLSVGVDAQVFRGGAHGYRSLTFLNFNPQTGEELSTEELFTEDFTAYAEKVFREQMEIPEKENINSTGFWFENDRFHLPINIGFEPNSVILVYNPYEIAAYATGQIYVEIPKEEAQPFLKLQQQ